MSAHLCDINVWLALTLSEHVHHIAARDWLARIETPRAVLFCRVTQQSLLRLLTNRSVLAAYGNDPLTNRAAWDVYEAFVADARIALQADEPATLERHWRRFALRETASPKLWTDSYLAAFAVAEGHRLVTTDVAFRQFDGLAPEVLGG